MTIGGFEQIAQFIRLRSYKESCYAMMIGGYLDESFDPKQTGTFVVGGVLGRGIPIFELDRRWDELLKRNGVAYFKASDCEVGRGEFARFVAEPGRPTLVEREILDSIRGEFLDLISHPILHDPAYLCVHGVGVLQDDFYDVIRDPKAQDVLGDNPYRLAYDLAMIQCAWMMRELGRGDCVSFVCDEHEKYSPLATMAYGNLKATNPQAARYMGNFTSTDEKLSNPVQAADAVVYEIRKALKFSLGIWEQELRKHFSSLCEDHVVALITHTKREQLEYIVANHAPGQSFALDALMSFQPEDGVDKIRTSRI